jgi:hypothetical protein
MHGEKGKNAQNHSDITVSNKKVGTRQTQNKFAEFYAEIYMLQFKN